MIQNIVNRSEVVDVRYLLKVIFLCLASYNFWNTFEYPVLGAFSALYFLYIGVMNGSRRKDFSKRPPYRKLIAYLAIVPLAFVWMILPPVKSGVDPRMIFLPGIYILILTALQERSRGNGGFAAFVNFDGLVLLLASSFHAPRSGYVVVLVGFLLFLFYNTRRGSSFYKYLLFLALIVALGGASFGGYQYWKAHRNYGGGNWGRDYQLRNNMMGFDPISSLGSFDDNYNSKYNSQVVLRVWDSKPPRYMAAARYSIYAGGTWKINRTPLKTLEPAYYQVDYAVMEVADSLTRNARQVWVQSTLDNFGYVFAPERAVGFSAKDIDSLNYFPGGMVNGLNQKGKRADWYYFICNNEKCHYPDRLYDGDSTDLHIFPLYESFLDSVIDAMELQGKDSLKNKNGGMEIISRMKNFLDKNFTYSMQVPELNRGILKKGEDPLHVFWRVRKGYCEYYASLATLVLRRLGYPARYVTGFANPELTPNSSYGIFRRKNAHAWVEVKIDGFWGRFDPTPVVMNFGGEESLSWFANFWEGVQARFARWMHGLKEGSWRSHLDRWQNFLENASKSPVLYGIIVLLVLGLAARRFYVAYYRKSRMISARSALAKKWAKKLSAAEYQLSREGFSREAGETVGHFLKRLESVPLEGRSADSRKTLQEYEDSRWTL